MWKFGGVLGSVLWMVVPRKWLWRLFAANVFMTTKPAAPNGRELEVARALFRDQTVFGPEVPPLALAAARSAGFGNEPEHAVVDAQVLRFVVSNYGLGWRHDRSPHLWERGSPDLKLAELYAEEDGLQAEYERRLEAMWAARDELSAARGHDSVSAEVVAMLTKKHDAALKTWQKAKLALEASKGRRSDRQQLLQENYRRAQAGK